MIHLFLDSNIWLSLYHFSADDLEQFEKLGKLVNSEIKLYIPQQTYDEVIRNRDAKLKDSFTSFEKFDFRFPVFCKNYEEYEDFHQKYNELKKQHGIWCNKVKEDIDNKTLAADRVIDLFFNNNVIPISEEIVRRAEIRYRCGNPPGKDNKLGDAINWECLLENVPNYEDIYFVSADKDYTSSIDNQYFSRFLNEEWKKKKSSNILFYKSLVGFFKENNFEDIQLKNETLKDSLVHDLYESANFLSTHRIIAELSRYSDWTIDQINMLYVAAIENSQIHWIIHDDDVSSFYRELLKKYDGSEEAKQLIEIIGDNNS